MIVCNCYTLAVIVSSLQSWMYRGSTQCITVVIHCYEYGVTFVILCYEHGVTFVIRCYEHGVTVVFNVGQMVL